MSQNPEYLSLIHSIQEDPKVIESIQENPAIIYAILTMLKKPKREQLFWAKLLTQETQEPVLSDIIHNLVSVRDCEKVPEQTRANTLERVNRFIRSAMNPSQFEITHNKRLYKPILSPYRAIFVQLSGIGSELDDGHFCLVWEVNRNQDQMVVVPTTSFKPNKTRENGLLFSIGKVGHLEGETVVKIANITTVSRKRILTSKWKPPGSDRLLEVRLTPEQINRIQDGIDILNRKERTLLEEIIKYGRFPVWEDYERQIEHLHRPYRIDRQYTTADTLVYRVSGDSTPYTITRYPLDVDHRTFKLAIYSWVHTLGHTTSERRHKQRRTYERLLKQFHIPS